MAFVPDASVAAAWVLPDEEATLAELTLDRLGNETANVPGLFWHELRNLLLSAERRGRIDARHADVSITRLRRLPIRSSGGVDDRHVMALARDHRLTAYDASYLALAIRDGCALASLDRRLTEAAATEGVPSLMYGGGRA
ncbi:MAG: type II toxin-antitoxin system VapC family toxin [Acidobacteria bacterium]|nr:type II toxin-antitoxin system VapC family toxin [Acidobacteriota bacterium]